MGNVSRDRVAGFVKLSCLCGVGVAYRPIRAKPAAPMRALWSLLVLLPVVACAAESREAAVSSTDELSAFDGGIGADANVDSGDGVPERRACTTAFGRDLGGAWHGRLDGRLVSIVPSHTHSCRGDNDHIHLQVLMGGSVYDVAINVDDVGLGEVDGPLPDPWTEGWHSNEPFDYVRDLGVRSSQFRSIHQSALEQQLQNELASVNYISIYSTRYSNGGTHLVHRSRNAGRNLDGAIVLQPTSAKPHYLLFKFPDQAF